MRTHKRFWTRGARPNSGRGGFRLRPCRRRRPLWACRGNPRGAPAAPSFDLKDLIREALSIPSTTGNEELLAGKILSHLPKTGVEKDNLGSVYAKFGQGGAKLAISAPRSTNTAGS